MLDYFTVKNAAVLLNQKKNHSHIPLCTNVESVLTIMPEKNKNDTVKFGDYLMQTM